MRCRAWSMIGLISKWPTTSQIIRPLERQTDRLSRGKKTQQQQLEMCGVQSTATQNRQNRWSLEDVEGVEVLAVASQVKDVSISTDPDNPGEPPVVIRVLSISPAAWYLVILGRAPHCQPCRCTYRYPGSGISPLFSWDVATIYAFSLTPPLGVFIWRYNVGFRLYFSAVLRTRLFPWRSTKLSIIQISGRSPIFTYFIYSIYSHHRITSCKLYIRNGD